MVHKDPQFERTIDQVEKDHRAAEMRTVGATYAQIGAQFGVTRQAAHVMVQRALADVPREGTLELVALELAKIDYLERKSHSILAKHHVFVSQGGKVVYDGNEKLEDDGPAIQAINTLSKLAERRSKLLGLNAPTNVRLEVVNYGTDAIDAEFEEFKQRALDIGLGDSTGVLDEP